ncbi:unnamed protein product [Dovyalis caffra]|uniref:Uncharacterized protein n=1 Tax=Dovyalis caffra TaxID=77055 RepID=A0AAV1SFA1_9ROSI|nr:unnamed protein product [Dovyalis caffra]
MKAFKPCEEIMRRFELLAQQVVSYASMLKQWGKHLKACTTTTTTTTTHERESSHMNGPPYVMHDDSDDICHQWNKLWGIDLSQSTALVVDQARIN